MCDIEHGKCRRPSAQLLASIADALDVSIEFLVDDNVEKPDQKTLATAIGNSSRVIDCFFGTALRRRGPDFAVLLRFGATCADYSRNSMLQKPSTFWSFTPATSVGSLSRAGSGMNRGN